MRKNASGRGRKKKVIDSLAKSKEVLQELMQELLMEDIFYQEIGRISEEDIDTLFGD